jgi:hypothetical protein
MRSLSVSLFLFLADFASAANVSEIPSFARPKFSISTIEKDGLLFPHRKTYQRLTVGQDTRQSLRCPKNDGLARRREPKKCEQLLLLLQVDYYLRTQIPHHASPELFFAVRRLVSLGWKICRTSCLLEQRLLCPVLEARSFSISSQKSKTLPAHGEAPTSLVYTSLPSTLV